MKKKPYTAPDIVKALARRHKDDMFFTEVKDGPTQTVRHHHKIDALAIKISWTNFGIAGYEIKISRSDFMRDEKWRAYLPMCNQLSFVVAPGVCDISEIPENCGFITLTEKGGLRTVRKAPWRDIEEPVSMYKYLMFTYINSFWQMEGRRARCERLLVNDREEILRNYLEDKADLKELGRRVSRKLGEEMRCLRRVAEELEALKKDEKRADRELLEICNALNVQKWGYNRLDECLREIEQLKASGGVSLGTLGLVRQINSLSGRLLADFEQKEGDVSSGNIQAAYRGEEEPATAVPGIGEPRARTAF